MAYQFDFAFIPDYAGMFAHGLAYTVGLTVAGGAIGIGIGIGGAISRLWNLRPFGNLYRYYVELFRNTPFLVQLFLIFFGLPSLGIKLVEWQAAILAMVLNLGAYSTEIIRAGLQATPPGQIEAAESLALTRWQTFLYVMLRPALRKVWPALSSQVVITMLGSSVCSQISAEELTFVANFIQSRNFRAFETYFFTTAMYFGLALLIRQAMRLIGRHLIVRRPLS
ncbi:amino acid ABC transporter permease [Propionivibrio dicarboxylicus]|uniref:Amino acid ABC transporter membrane protein 1, PAAT family n=1 Tax=Propionivibrio dicarboxylicus TaxID=83767 RepID=A0A1G8JJQ5_9RHOO|nr:amino acid ABC transporter permease [Propionivibrio dicarboxylicus]SDI31386.1 amino acid ABC transporter membrane protein 1, PAAT family [Propionivibrio dicarboxylicus]